MAHRDSMLGRERNDDWGSLRVDGELKGLVELKNK